MIAATTILPPADLPKQCTCCGAVLTDAQWRALPYVGLQDDGDEGWLELRNHGCGSTLARDVTLRQEHRRDEGDDAVAEERAERELAWRERGW